MSRSSFTERLRRGAVLCVGGFLAVTAPRIACAQSSETSSEEGCRIVAVEWIPLHAHASILKALEENLAKAEDNAPVPAPIERINVFGDEEELSKSLAALAEKPPALNIGFGNYMCVRLRTACPRVPLLGLLVRPPINLPENLPAPAGPVVCPSTEPDPQLVWRVVRELAPGAATLGIVFSEGYAPNAALADELETAGKTLGARVFRITVPRGFCRTDSDFEKALEGLSGAQRVDLLYAPDDPNCSRFGTQIYRYADAARVPAIGSEATIGKGYVAAIALDYDAIGRHAAALCRKMTQGTALAPAAGAVPPKILVDRVALAKYGITLSPWLEENAQWFK